MGATLQALNELPDELPPLSVSSRRAGYKLEGEWTRSVLSCHDITHSLADMNEDHSNSVYVNTHIQRETVWFYLQ